MIEINLLPVREARRKADLRELLMQLMLALLMTAGLIALVHSRLSDDVDLAATRVRQMEHDIEQFKPQLAQVAAFRKQKSKLEKKIDVIDGLDRARSGPVRVLAELATRTPDRLWLTSLVTQGKTLTLKGESIDNELVALFLRALDESEYFTDVDLESSVMAGDRKGVRLVSFNINAVLASPSRPAKAGDAAAG
jgi:type IV pilus assembly protein PilN